MFKPTHQTQYRIMMGFATIFLLSAWLFNSTTEIVEGYIRIVMSPSILLSDYFVIGNLGASFFNAGLIMWIAIIIALINDVKLTGAMVAAFFTLAGFALFGKNGLNIWPILLGVWIYARYQREKFSKFIVIAFFATALSPMVSQLAFGFGWAHEVSIPLALLLGIIAGFMFPPLASHFVRFHQGYNIYNVGFTSGMIGMIFMAFFRSFGLNNPPTLHISSGNNGVLSIYLSLYFSLILIIGLLSSNQLVDALKGIFKQSGRLVSDYLSNDGFGPTMVNMSLLGFMSMTYVLLIQGDLSGPALGGIFTIVGFGAFGKHVKNIFPVLVGVYLSTYLNIWDPNTPGAILAALFGTTLAPIAGTYGWFSGVIAGFFHMVVVMNVGVMHGGMNLYNNGFSGGFVAAVLVPLLDALKRNQQT